MILQLLDAGGSFAKAVMSLSTTCRKLSKMPPIDSFTCLKCNVTSQPQVESFSCNVYCGCATYLMRTSDNYLGK